MGDFKKSNFSWVLKVIVGLLVLVGEKVEWMLYILYECIVVFFIVFVVLFYVFFFIVIEF